MDTRWARVARGWLAAGVAILVAAVSHTLAGGSAPSAFGILVSLVIAGTICTVLTGRTLSLGRLAASVALSQFLFHTVFSSLGTPVIVGHHMGSMTLDATAAPDAATTMWLAHAVAALVTVIAFRRGEAAFWGLAELARLAFARLFVAIVPVAATPPKPAPVATTAFAARDLSLLLSVMRHRGPPLARCR